MQEQDSTVEDGSDSDSSDEQDALAMDFGEDEGRVGSPQKEEQELVVEEQPDSQARSQVPSGSGFPSFPAPVAPEAPSKSDLAIQGVDKALIHAEVIDPATVLPVLPSGEDKQTRLGEKTRKRLLELGITELFAGQEAESCLVTTIADFVM